MKDIQFFNQLSDRGCQWQECTLLMPAVSVGNVGQLAVDLLVTTLIWERKVKLVGRIFSTALKSVSGPNAYQFDDDSPIMTTCEVYESVDHKLVILQLRAPPYKERSKQFVEELSKWIGEEKFKLAICLSSSFSQYLSPQIFDKESKPIRYISTNILKENSPSILSDQLKVTELKEESENDEELSISAIVGGGLTKTLYQYWQKENVPGLLLVIFCSEGDNTPEAMEILETANKIIKVKEPITSSKPQNRWKTPISWMQIFGGAIPNNLF
ncbi:proteasome assembly chaperone 2 [Tetranychus urticae]|uniref:Proteasome assembly chaperone 2 n=1 Tax=Tetranychus urticae TaxID=32264 RepID=T1JX81_TETUR|nr:proteasome assembly chaperone 2 [Tetranychus urticae]